MSPDDVRRCPKSCVFRAAAAAAAGKFFHTAVDGQDRGISKKGLRLSTFNADM